MAQFNGPASAIEDNRLKVQEITKDSTEEQYPSALAVYNALSNYDESSNNNKFSNALKGSIIGEAIAIKDISPLTHKVKVQLSSDTITDFTSGSQIVVDTSSERSMTGLSLTNARVYWECGAIGGVVLNLSDGQTVSLTSESSSYGEKMDVTLKIEGTVCTEIGQVWLKDENGEWQTNGEYSYTRPVAEGTVIIGYECRNSLCDGTYPDDKLQIWDLNGKAVTLTQYGKNLLKYPFTHTTRTINGVTFTDNGDGSITVNGTATSNAVFNLKANNADGVDIVAGKTIRISGCPVGGGVAKYFLRIQTREGSAIVAEVTDYGGGTGVPSTTIPTDITFYHFFICVIKGATVENLVFRPQLELGKLATEYEPYIEPKTYTANADGTVDVEYMYPSMTLMTDTDGVTIKAEYNRDINKAFAELQAALVSLGGNV